MSRIGVLGVARRCRIILGVYREYVGMRKGCLFKAHCLILNGQDLGAGSRVQCSGLSVLGLGFRV